MEEATQFARITESAIEATEDPEVLKILFPINSIWKYFEIYFKIENLDFVESPIGEIFNQSRQVRKLSAILEWLSGERVMGSADSLSLLSLFRQRKFDKAIEILEDKKHFSTAAILRNFAPNEQDPILASAISGLDLPESYLIIKKIAKHAIDRGIDKDFEILGFAAADVLTLHLAPPPLSILDFLFVEFHCLYENSIFSKINESEISERVVKICETARERYDLENSLWFLVSLILQEHFSECINFLIKNPLGNILCPQSISAFRSFSGYFGNFISETFSLEHAADPLVELQIQDLFARHKFEVACGASACFLAEHLMALSPRRRRVVWAGCFLELGNFPGTFSEAFQIPQDLSRELINRESFPEIIVILKQLLKMVSEMDLEGNSNFLAVALGTAAHSIYFKMEDNAKLAGSCFYTFVGDLLAISANLEVASEILKTLESNQFSIILMRGGIMSEFLGFAKYLEELGKDINHLEKLKKLQKRARMTFLRAQSSDRKKLPEIERSLAKINREISEYSREIGEKILTKTVKNEMRILIQPNDSALNSLIWEAASAEYLFAALAQLPEVSFDLKDLEKYLREIQNCFWLNRVLGESKTRELVMIFKETAMTLEEDD